MDIELSKTSLYRLPEKAEFALFIIREELKNRRFISALEQVGLDPTFCQHDFGTIVLVSCGFTEITDEPLSIYNDILDRCCKRFSPGDEEALKAVALEVYVELQIVKRKMSNEDLTCL